MEVQFGVVIATRNRATKLRSAIESALNQSHAPREIWVVDDGHDNARTVVSRCSASIHYLRGRNEGVAAARNLAIAQATTDYVAFLDDDDRWYPQKLERVASVARKHPEVALFYSRFDVVNSKGEVLWRPHVKRVRGDGYRALLSSNFIANSTVVARRDRMNEVGGFDVTLRGCEDWELWVRLARRYPIFAVTDNLVAYELLSAGSATSRPDAWLAAYDEVLAKCFSLDPELPDFAKRRIESNSAYVKGRILLVSGGEAEALRLFRRAIGISCFQWRALIYTCVLSQNWLRRILPRQVKICLRLPESYA
jgi:glycosyltransferase involved in cell wall biosynthesis